MKTSHRYQPEIYAAEEAVRADRKLSLSEARKKKYRFALRFTGKYRSFYVGDKTSYVSMMAYSYGNLHFSEDPSHRKYFTTATQAVEFKHTLMVPVDVVWAYIPPSEQTDKVPGSDKEPQPK